MGGPSGEHRRRLPGRGTDHLEDVVAWLLTTGAVGVVLLAVLVGQVGYAHTAARSHAEAATRTPTRARLLEDVDGTAVTDGGRPRTVLAQWDAPDGHEAQGRVVVSTRHAAGDSLSIWTDRAGRVVPAPLSVGSAVIVAWMWGLAVALAGWALLALVWTAVRAWTARRNAAAWAREWAGVEPWWSGRVP